MPMIKLNPIKITLTPEKAVKILAKHGQKVTLTEDRFILDFVYNFAILSSNQVLKDDRMKEVWKK
jgi:hypothetical protein